MRELCVTWEDIEESRAKGSGPGGQKVNKTSNRVTLAHRQSGASARSHATRSLERNRLLALRGLLDAVEQARTGRVARRAAAARQVRKQKDRRRRRALVRDRGQNEEGPIMESPQ